MSIADQWSPIGASPSWLQGWPQRYTLAVIAVAIATAARYGLVVAVGPLPPFVLFVPAIVVVVLLAGFGPGVLATLVSAISVASFFWNSLNVFGESRPREIVGLCLFCGIGIGASWLADVYRRHESTLREFERVVEGLEEGIIVLDRDYRYVVANRAFQGYRGIGKEQILGRSVADFMEDELFSNSVRPKLDECFQGKIVKYEKRYKYPGMEERDFSVSYFPIEGPRGIQRVGCILQDITEQKRAEHALKMFRTLIDESNDAVQVMDPETLRFLDVNEKACKDLGYTREELLSMSVFDIDPGVGEACRAKALEHLLVTGSLIKEVEHRRKDGSTFPVECSLKYVRLDRDYVVAVSRDISDRKRAEAALREEEDRYRDLVEHSEDLLCTHDLEGRLLTVNAAPARILGYSVEELLKIPMRDLVIPEARELFDQYLERLRTTGQPEKGLLCVITKSGEIRTWEYNNTLRTEGVSTPIVRGMAHDITERRRAELALRNSEQRYRVLFEENIAGVATSTLEGKILDCNQAWARMLGYDSPAEIRGCQTREFYFDPSEQPLLMKEFEGSGSVLSGEIRMRRKDGTAVWVLFNSSIRLESSGAVIQSTAIDITRRKGAEESLRRNEERFRVALKGSPITVFNQDRDLRYTWIYNSQLYWQKEILGKTDEEIIGPKKAAPLHELKRRVLRTGKPAREEVAIAHNGKNYVFDTAIEPLFDAEQKVCGITGACMDVARLRELADSLQNAKNKLIQEKTYLEKEIEAELGFEEIIGHSSSLRDVLKKARIVAPTDSTVLLLGETGTGKELVARSIHSLSARRDKTFVKLNCAAVPSGLLESELFGHEKGAFTGAVSQKIGRVELADKGTLFLDEIGELPPELQPKLLRVLQDREFERLGGVQTLRVDVRIVSATNRDLRQDVADKRFREDLFYRLNVFPIELPALRERREDIPILVEHFVQKHAGRMGKHIDTIPDDAMQVLRNWSWPGNVRELENMIERMVILTKGGILASPPLELEDVEYLADENLTDMEREHIIRVLRQTKGVLSGSDGAARRLGIKRTTLQSMMKRLGIEADEFRHGTGTGTYGK